jgi:hypothetical protein
VIGRAADRVASHNLLGLLVNGQDVNYSLTDRGAQGAEIEVSVDRRLPLQRRSFRTREQAVSWAVQHALRRFSTGR